MRMIKKLGYKTVTEFYQDIANETKLTIDRVRVTIPEELGKLILLYKYLVGIGDTDPMFSIIVSSMKMVEASLKKMLFRFSPQEIQEAVKNDDYQLPVYTASLFRLHRLFLTPYPFCNPPE